MAGRGGQHQGVGRRAQGRVGAVQLKTCRPVVQDQRVKVTYRFVGFDAFKNKPRARVKAARLALIGGRWCQSPGW